MTVRIVTTGGPAVLAFVWDGVTQYVDDGTFIDVPPGSALESAIGLANLAAPTAAQLGSAANGGGPGWTSNA
jgi:hypothetical protein